MSIFTSIKDFFLPPENNYDDQSAEEKSKVKESISSSDNSSQRNSQRDAFKNEEKRVLNVTTQLQVVLVKPELFADAKKVADHLIDKKTVVLNLETCTPDNKKRIIDFLAGVAYANKGNIKPIANLTYIITPYNVGFVGEELVSELENNGIIM